MTFRDEQLRFLAGGLTQAEAESTVVASGIDGMHVQRIARVKIPELVRFQSMEV